MASFPVDGHGRDGSVDVERLLRDITCQVDVLRSFHGCQGGDCISVEAPTDNQAGENALEGGIKGYGSRCHLGSEDNSRRRDFSSWIRLCTRTRPGLVWHVARVSWRGVKNVQT